MAKENSNPPDKSGTPTALLVSIVCAIIVFAMAEIKSSFALTDTFPMRFVLLSYVALGLAIAFFWKRLERSPFLKIAGGTFLFGLWVSLFMTTLAPVLLKGEHVHGLLMVQFGFGFVVLSGFSLVVAMLQNQKMVPSLLFSAIGAIALLVTGGAGFFVKHSGSGEEISSKGDKSDEISAHTLAAKSPVEDDEHDAHQETHDDGHAVLDPKEEGGDEHGDAHEAEEHKETVHKAKEHEEADDHLSPHKAGHDAEKKPEAPKKADAHAKPTPAAAHAAVDAMVDEFSHDAKEHAAAKSKEKSPKPLNIKPSKSKNPPVASLEHALSEPKNIGSKKVSELAKKKALKGELSWSYEAGPMSPETWGSLADEFRKCSVGQTQSPIDIPSAWPLLGDVSLDYKLTNLSIIDTGRTIQFNVGKQNTATIGGKPYELVQFHIHTPSEHWIDGRASPMEIHFVHKDKKGALAVLSVLVEAGVESKTFNDMWGYVPQTLDMPAAPRGKVFNIATLVPQKTKVYRYRGSLTTPPCSENVLWSVAAEKLTMSKDQIDAFRMRYKNNARPIQKRSTTAH